MARADKAEDAEYQKRYLQNPDKKAQHKASCDRNRRANAEFRKSILAQFGCLLCDITDPDLIDWHHVYPEDKLFDIKGALGRNHSLWWDEVLSAFHYCLVSPQTTH